MDQSFHEVFISFSFKDQPIAETIVNKLLNTYHISCWICTQDIRAGENYKKTIVKAINEATVLLLIQSENSMHSQEVPKEVSIALKKNKTVIPFVIDNSELSEDLEYDLLTVQRVDARKPTLDERIEELARQIYGALGRPFEKDESGAAAKEGKRRLVSTSSVVPKKIFCGRDALLSDIAASFDSGERVTFLYGIGGIGKTQIAKQYAKQYKNDYDVIIYATYDKTIRDIVLSDNIFTLEPSLIRYNLDDGSQEDDESFYRRKLDAVKSASNERTLVILDNFDVEEDPCLADLVDGRYRLLITTRCDYSRYYNTIKIDPIDSIEQLKDIFMQNYDGFDVEREDPLLSELIELVNRHTYTVELLALHMENSGQTVEEMISALKKEGILSLNEEVRGTEMKTSVAYENLLKMFKIFSLTEEERRVLTYLSLMPICGVGSRNFRDWADLSSPKIIKSLEQRSWVIRNVDGIALHPIIRQVVKHEIPATEENCGEFIDRYTETVLDKHAWHFKLDEKERYITISKSILEQFPEITPRTEELYHHIYCLVSYAFKMEYGIELGRKMLDFQKKNTGDISFKTARAAFMLGWIYANNSTSAEMLNKARSWLEYADEIFCQVEMHTTDEISRWTLTKNNLVTVYLKLYSQTKNEEYYEKAQACAEFSLKKAEECFKPGDYHYAKIGGAHMQLTKILIEKGRYEEAIPHMDYEMEILISMFGESDADVMIGNWRKGLSLSRLGRCEEAKPYLMKASLGYPEFMGLYHVRSCSIYIELGDCLSRLSEHREAYDAYSTALEIAEKIYAPGSEQIKTAAEKAEKAKALI